MLLIYGLATNNGANGRFEKRKDFMNIYAQSFQLGVLYFLIFSLVPLSTTRPKFLKSSHILKLVTSELLTARNASPER
jgi:hypothetical protein